MLFTLRSIVLFSSSIAVALSHLVIPAGQPDDSYLMELARHLKKHFDIQHATVRVVAASHKRAVRSLDAVTTRLPSGLNAALKTASI